MKYIKLIILFFIFSLIQAAFFATPIRPALVLLLVICIAVFENREDALLLSFAAGIIEGIFFPDLIGIYIFSLALVTFLIILLKRRIFYENIFFMILLCVIFTLINEFVFYAFSFLYNDFLFYPFINIGWRLALNAVFIISVYYLYGYLFAEAEKLKIGLPR